MFLLTFGDADAVSVGDYNLPGAVGWALAGRVVDDAGMLELLAPYAGHRYRAARLVELSGLRPPRRGSGRGVLTDLIDVVGHLGVEISRRLACFLQQTLAGSNTTL